MFVVVIVSSMLSFCAVAPLLQAINSTTTTSTLYSFTVCFRTVLTIYNYYKSLIHRHSFFMRNNHTSKLQRRWVLPAPVQEDRLWSTSDIHTQWIWWRLECRCNFQSCGALTYIPWNICRCLLHSPHRPTARESFNKTARLYNVWTHKIWQLAQLSQRDRAAGWASFGEKEKTGTGRQYFTDIIGLSSTTVT